MNGQICGYLFVLQRQIKYFKNYLPANLPKVLKRLICLIHQMADQPNAELIQMVVEWPSSQPKVQRGKI